MHGLYLLWWVQEQQISAAAVASLMAAGNFVLMLCEVPTGWFADRFGHRASLILGSALQIVAMLWCWLGEGAAGVAIACVLVAIADAFRSGSDQALVYRSCLALEREADFQRLEARSNAAELGALLGLLVAGGVIVQTWGFAAGWIAETALAAVGLAIACAMTEPPAEDSHDDDDTNGRDDMRTLLATGIMRIIAPVACLGGLAGAAAFIVQSREDVGAIAVTALVAMLTLAEAAGSILAVRTRNGGARQQVLLLTAGIALCAAAAVLPGFFPVTVGGLAFLSGLAGPLRDTAIQRVAPDGARARAASLASACDMAVSALTLPLAGYWRMRR
jgi:hypothetical protein